MFYNLFFPTLIIDHRYPFLSLLLSVCSWGCLLTLMDAKHELCHWALPQPQFNTFLQAFEEGQYLIGTVPSLWTLTEIQLREHVCSVFLWGQFPKVAGSRRTWRDWSNGSSGWEYWLLLQRTWIQAKHSHGGSQQSVHLIPWDLTPVLMHIYPRAGMDIYTQFRNFSKTALGHLENNC